MVRYVGDLDEVSKEGDYTYSNGIVRYSNGISILFADSTEGRVFSDSECLFRIMAQNMDVLTKEDVEKMSRGIAARLKDKNVGVTQVKAAEIIAAVYFDLKGQEPV